jgi:hypothetical protein
MRDDWYRDPSGASFDFVEFARTEGRFAHHFTADGTASDEMRATAEDRLENWRLLQEMAGVVRVD